jgi:hypothetical protein
VIPVDRPTGAERRHHLEQHPSSATATAWALVALRHVPGADVDPALAPGLGPDDEGQQPERGHLAPDALL